MSFSFRVAPGARIRVSSRGVRTGIGPRAPRQAGAVGSVPAPQGSRWGGAGRSQPCSRCAPAHAAEVEQAPQDPDGLAGLLTRHRLAPPPATAPLLPPRPVVNAAAVRAEHVQRALADVGRFRFGARRRALAAAHADAVRHVAQLDEDTEYLWQQAQQRLDVWWHALRRNKPEVVLAALTAEFEVNDACAAVVGIDHREVALVALVPGLDAIPQRWPASAVAPRSLTTGERGSLHAVAVASQVLLTVRAAFAVAPGLAAARVLALQYVGDDAGGGPRVDVLLAARFERLRLDAVRWDCAGALDILCSAAAEVVLDVRGSFELRPLDLRDEPALAALVARVQVDRRLARA